MGQPRVCIVGGGAAGLAAAWYLQKRGYRHVVVLEKEARPGGKCDTVSVDGRSFELGAFTTTLAYGDVMEIAAEVGAAAGPQPKRLGIRWDRNPPQVKSLLASVLEGSSLGSLVLAQLRYVWLLFKTRKVLGPAGFGQVSDAGPQPELCLPFGEYARQHGITPLVDVFRLAVDDMGYGHISEVPAAFILKYMSFWNVVTITLYMLGIGFGWPKRFLQGYGRLWQCVAWRLDVRLQATVQRIQRTDGKATVQWTEVARNAHGVPVQREHTEVFDHLVLACPLDATEAFLDARDDERALYYGNVIQWNDYYVTLCRTQGIPQETLDAMHGLEPGHSWEILHSWPDAPITSFYSVGPPPITGETVIEALKADVARAFPRAQVDTVVQQKHWKYFPHVSDELLRGGYYTRLEAQQGRHGTYVTGALPAFETVENVVAYSRALVETHFPPLAAKA